MDFERFIEKINNNIEYKTIVKKVLSNEPCALQDAKEYLKDEKELVLFVSRFDRLIGEHISTNLKKDKEFLLEFSKYNHTAPYFMDDSLRTNKKFLLDLIKVNYKTLLLLNLDYILALKMKTIRLSRLLFERYTTESENLTNILNKHNIPYEILENTKDIWMRDFMPFCLDDGTLVSYIYEPDYLQGVKYKNIKTKINYEINHIDLVIDGGNFVRYKNKAIMTDKVFKENPSKTKDEIIEMIKSKCKLDDLIIIPKQPYDIYGHSDSMIRWINENSVLINDFSVESKTFNDKLLKAFQKHNLNIQTMKYSSDFFTKDRDWGAYLNFIKLENILIVPIYGLKEDILALKQLQNVYKNCIIEPINFSAIIKEGGALHCVSSEKIGV